MSPTRYEFCKMFVRADAPADVFGVLTEILDGTVVRRSVELPGATVEVLRNPDASIGDAADFLFWPVLVEIESDGSPAVVDLAARILSHLWDLGYPTVAACDYEEELPWRGGIARSDK
jgi:hypothetical protein